MNQYNYEVTLKPLNGLTLERRTREEFSLGYTFIVTDSEHPSIRRGMRVTQEDFIPVRESNYDVDYTINFEILTAAQYVEQQDNDSYLPTSAGWVK